MTFLKALKILQGTAETPETLRWRIPKRVRQPLLARQRLHRFIVQGQGGRECALRFAAMANRGLPSQFQKAARHSEKIVPLNCTQSRLSRVVC